MAPYFILQWILMVLFTGLTVSGSPVRGVVGQNVTLPCKYRVNHQNDITTMCWGRGSCSLFQCSQTILWTDGRRVTERQSSRYRLEGNLAQGDVSLTIVNAAEADGGMYCCRVEIPGWFNDQKNNLEVVIETARTSTTSPHAYTPEHTSAAANASDTSSAIVTTMATGFQFRSPSDCFNIAAHATQVSSSVTPRWLSISSPEAPWALNVPTSVHPLEAESRRTGMYIRISVILSLLVLLILSLLIFTWYLHNT